MKIAVSVSMFELYTVHFIWVITLVILLIHFQQQKLQSKSSSKQNSSLSLQQQADAFAKALQLKRVNIAAREKAERFKRKPFPPVPGKIHLYNHLDRKLLYYQPDQPFIFGSPFSGLEEYSTILKRYMSSRTVTETRAIEPQAVTAIIENHFVEHTLTL